MTQLHAFTTLRIYLDNGMYAYQHYCGLTIPNRLVARANSAGQMAIDTTPGTARYLWNGNALTRSVGGFTPPLSVETIAFGQETASLMNALFAAIRTSTWVVKSPSEYGLGPQSGGRYVEIPLPSALANGHLFLRYGGNNTGPYASDPRERVLLDDVIIYAPGCEEPISYGVVRWDYNPTLPPLAFDPTSPTYAVPFPKRCPRGLTQCPNEVEY